MNIAAQDPVFVQQIDDGTCVHACLAIVTKQTIQSIINQAGSSPLNLRIETRVLVHAGLLPTRCPENVFPYVGLYLVTVPSINRLGLLHRVVGIRTEHELQIIDPQDGRQNRASHGAFVPWPKGLDAFEVTFLDHEILR